MRNYSIYNFCLKIFLIETICICIWRHEIPENKEAIEKTEAIFGISGKRVAPNGFFKMIKNMRNFLKYNFCLKIFFIETIPTEIGDVTLKESTEA